jgi:group II intron reverse transcriptase/maturase
VFEANFQDCSYGFRPKRSARQAVVEVKEALVRGWWVIDADIQGYFQHIDHGLLMQLVKRRISDKRVRKLLMQWLKAGVLEEGEWTSTEEGTPQGGVISPLLANIYLHVMDMYWKQSYQKLGKLFRYADDFVVICRNRQDAGQAMKVIQAIMGKLKLTLHPTKTRMVDTNRGGFEFLGFHFHKAKSWRTGKKCPWMWPGQRAMKTIRGRIRELTHRRWMVLPLEEVIRRLNPVIRGWSQYFRMGNATRKLQALDRYVAYRMGKFFRGRLGRRKRRWVIRYLQWRKTSGLLSFYEPGICGQATIKP